MTTQWLCSFSKKTPNNCQSVQRSTEFNRCDYQPQQGLGTASTPLGKPLYPSCHKKTSSSASRKQLLENADYFPHLLSPLSGNANIDEGIEHHLSSASAALGRSQKRVSDSRNIRSNTKLTAYSAAIISTSLHGVGI